jgi:fibro-slime domain-containing protein
MALRRHGALLSLGVVGLLAAYGCAPDNEDSAFPPTDVNAEGGPGDPNQFGTPDGMVIGPEGGPAKPTCGNSAKDTGETCDDGNGVAGDGCSATCQIEPGWKCDTIGAACVATACGDGIVAGNEDCDDGNTASSDGCSAICVLESGFKCTVPGKACTPTVCGDSKKEGTEQCDDGNVRPYDGCSADCTLEPKCAAGTCTAVCGDGVKFPGEACDDGNTRSGDGCSATCTLEPGFNCTVVTSDLPASIDVPIILRDFQVGHPDFETYNGGLQKGMVAVTLAADGRPVLSATHPQMTSDASFFDWYHDGANSKTVISKLTMAKQPDDSYVYANTSFFPLDGLGWGNTAGQSHNFHFTSELRYYFTFKGGEVLSFLGDDDVYVFINNKLAVDIGGVHGAQAGSVTLDPATATALGLTAGGMYELDVFQAERHTTQSNYKLTLAGFVKARTSCVAICGDGIKTKNEACDDGKNTGGYGKCGPGCVLGPRCGDGVVQSADGEQCDDGNLVSGDGCSSTCQTDVAVPK